MGKSKRIREAKKRESEVVRKFDQNGLQDAISEARKVYTATTRR